MFYQSIDKIMDIIIVPITLDRLKKKEALYDSNPILKKEIDELILIGRTYALKKDIP